jgi:hypothetical protein
VEQLGLGKVMGVVSNQGRVAYYDIQVVHFFLLVEYLVNHFMSISSRKDRQSAFP